jgi:hypothetical protein
MTIANSRLGGIAVLAISLLLLCLVADRAGATIIPVTNTNDSGTGSLRQALAIANNGDTIDATGISGIILLTTGQLVVDKSVTITGAGAEVLAIDGNATSSVFHITAGEVTISALTIRNGQGEFGGGVLNDGTLTIVDSTVTGNTAGFGGGTFNAGTLNIVDCTFSGNNTTEGGGVYSSSGTTLTITNSTFSGNAASVAAASIVNHGTLHITNSTFSNNLADFVSGVMNTGTFELGNTVLNAGESGANISNFGTVISLGFNLSSDNGGGFLNGPGDQINTDPLLGPLQENGGPTFTHALLPGSPAIDSGDPNFTPPPFFDQRGAGFDRIRNGRIDKGSFEVQSGSTPSPTPAATPTPSSTPTPTATPTSTATPTPSATSSPTVTPTSTPLPTPTPTPATTPTPTATATARPTVTPRAMPTPRSRPTPMPRL